MDERPTFVERVPQVFSLALAIFAVAFAVTWDTSRAVAMIPLAGAIASLVLRLWLPVRRRRKYGS
jgi:hypothetical protein